MWCLPEFSREVVALAEHEQTAAQCRYWHALTTYGGYKQVSVNYLPHALEDDNNHRPLEFELWRVHRQAGGEERTLWEAFLKRAAHNQPKYLVLNRLAVSKEPSQEAPDAVPIGFAASQIALEHRLQKEPFQWIISQQRKELCSVTLAAPGARPLFMPASQSLGLDKSEQVAFDWSHQKARMLRARYPGYWFDYRELRQKLMQLEGHKPYRRAFECVWERMAGDGLRLDSDEPFRVLAKPRNLKYLALAFLQDQELFEYCNSMTAPGPFCSITPRQAWVDSCRDVCVSSVNS